MLKDALSMANPDRIERDVDVMQLQQVEIGSPNNLLRGKCFLISRMILPLQLIDATNAVACHCICSRN